MGIRNSHIDKAVFLYDSVSGRALPIESFEDEDLAEDFLRWFRERYDDSNLHDPDLVNQARDSWAAERLDDEGELIYDE